MALDTKLFGRQQKGGLYIVLDRGFIPGEAFWVGAASDGASDATSYGSHPDSPFATLDFAFDSVTASKADTVFVLPEHTEATITGSITIDKIGVSVIGIGHHGSRPTLTFTNTAGEILISADDVLFSNFNLVSGVNSLANFFDVAASGFTIENCRMTTGSATEAVCFVNLTTTKDWLTIKGCDAFQPSDPEATNNGDDTGFLYMEDSEHILVEDCRILGYFETAMFHNKGTKCTDFLVNRCLLQTVLSTSFPFKLVSDAEGGVRATLNLNVVADDVTDAKLWGTIGDRFWINKDSASGNDSAAGGQAAVQGEAAT